MCEYIKLKTKNWNLKSLYEMSRRNLKFWNLKCLNTEKKCLNTKNWKLDYLNIENKKLKFLDT
jgi:hypothetical protein